MRKVMVREYFRIAIAATIFATMAIVASKPSHAYAQNVQGSSGLNARAQGLIPLFNKETAYDSYFAPNFLEAIPPSQLDRLISDISAQYGRAIRVVSITADSQNGGMIKIQFERAVATVLLYTDNRSPFRVTGLRLEGFEIEGDDYQAIINEIRALPGNNNFAIHRLNEAGQQFVAGHNGDSQLAIGSVFKLYILAELADQIASGQKRWSDVAILSPKSTTSGGTQNWPEGTPLTLQSLATLMISISDNNTTDTLLRHLGRSNVERQVRQIGHSNIDKMLPFLSTAELFTLKMRRNKKLRERYISANESEQQRLLIGNAKDLTIDKYDATQFGSGPLFIDNIEWFASPADIARVMNKLRNSSDPIVAQILSLNSGIASGDARRWNYLGYKGGSEPGVISMSFLVQSKNGEWYSVSGGWNNPRQEVDQGKWVAIMTRVLNILAQ